MDLNLAPQFQPEASHLDGLFEERAARIAGRIPLGLSFLDDCVGGLYPKDLMLLGAGTGVGKTALASQVAMAGANVGREVYLFALEAFVGEISARLYFEELGRRAREPSLDFAGWWRGQWKGLDAKHKEAIMADLRPRLARVHTLYKERGDFTPANLSQQLEAVADKAGLIILDHLHVIDIDADRSELSAQKRTVRLLRDIALDLSVPVVAVSHVRKRDVRQAPTLLPDVEDLHGSSDIIKTGTQVVVFGREWDGPRPKPYLSPTLMSVAKDRGGRHSRLVARMYYDLSTASYEENYELGHLEWRDRRQQFVPLTYDQIPHWADREAQRVIHTGEIPF